ncbi:MAG: ABC transporter permease [Planctomycetes bacterium]|nr:ABC transporter permease [Planctomycetota bacterium]
MLEILRMQLRAMLGGKRKWLVVLCLLLPVLLTVAASTSGGLGHLRRSLDRERAMVPLARGELPPTAHRVTWQGEKLSFAGGILVLDEKGLRLYGEPVGKGTTLVVNDGFLVVRNGELWIDPAKAGTVRSWRISYVGQDDVPAFDTYCAIYLFLLYPQAVCLLLALFYGTSVLADELDGKTLTYLFVRPLPRWRFVAGKYLGIVASLALPTAASLGAAWLIAGAPGGATLIGALLAATLAALCAYNALFVLFGFLVPRRAMIVALLYGVVFEFVGSFVPALVNEFTVTYYLRSLVARLLDVEIPREIARVVGGASVPGASLALLLITVVSLALAARLAARREYVVKDAA